MWKIFFKNIIITLVLFVILQLTKLVYTLDMFSVLFGVLYLALAIAIQRIWR